MRAVTAILTILGGFVASLGMFASGVALAAYFLAVETQHDPAPSVDVADLWTNEPRKIDPSTQDFERVPGVQVVVAAAPAAASPVDESALPPDTMKTAAIGSQAQADLEAQAERTAAHVAWCRSRYRSYSEAEDSFLAYSGERRPCVSPFSHDDVVEDPSIAAVGDEGEPVDDGWVVEASASAGEVFPADEGLGEPIVRYAADTSDTGFMSEEHISECFSRYQSYRVEDNSYQPYGGGPRRQCR